MLNAQEATARYEPRPCDASKETFAARLAVCETCPSRQGLSCKAANGQLCTIMARDQLHCCPERRWPGEAPVAPLVAFEPTSLLSKLIKWIRPGRRPKPTEAARGRVWVKRSTSVSIVIAARNYAQYLPEAIESALAQSVPCEVIYSDDASQDDSLSVARTFVDRGLVVLENPVHQGPAAARAKGCRVARGDWLINLDGDDVLPRNYVHQMLRVAAPDTSFVYGDAQAFGDSNHLWAAPWWEHTSLWMRNFVNTSAMYNRAIYHAAGGWQDGIGTMWDWDLALRAMRFGRPQRQQETPLLYRQHATSFSHAYHEHEEATAVRAREQVRRRLARLSVGSILSGRLPEIFPKWFDALARSVRQLQSPHPVDLVLLHHATDRFFQAAVRRVVAQHAGTFDTVRILPAGPQLEYATEEERRDEVARFLAGACNRLQTELRGDLHWIVEDDILVPLDAARILFAAATSGARPPEAVSGIYRNRHVPRRVVGGMWKVERHQQSADELEIGTLNESPSSFLASMRKISPLVLDLVGTGCLMYWRDRAPRWTSHLHGLIPAHDWAWSMEVKRLGGQVWLLPEVPCGHAVDEKATLGW